MKNLSKYLLLLLIMSACNNIENRTVDLEKAKNNPLLIPPCMNK